MNFVKTNQVNLEITTTNKCNLNCTYCFEGLDKNKLKHSNLTHKDFDFDGVKNVDFWGGEPTLNSKLILDVMKAHPNLNYHIYSNGYNTSQVLILVHKILRIIKKENLNIQISYDGKVITDLERKTFNGTKSSDSILKTFDELYKMDINLSMKATLPVKHFNKMNQVYDEFVELHRKYGVVYAPTIDTTDVPTKDDIKEFIKQDMMIAKKELQNYKEFKNFIFSWNLLDEERIICSAGKKTFCYNSEGTGYPCHGFMYRENSDIITTEFINNLKLERPEKCKDCIATYCLSCPANAFFKSKDSDPYKRWNDVYDSDFCELFKEHGKINRALIYGISKL